MNWLDAVRSGTRADQPAASTLGDGTLYRVTDEGNIVEIVHGGAWEAFGSDGSGSVDDTAYDATSWNGVTDVAPSKNAVRDKFESIGGGLVSDTAYDESTWNGVTTVAPSKNAVRDKIEALAATIPTVSDTAYDATSWDGVTTVAPSKNAVRDKVESLATAITAAVDDTAYDATSWNGDTTHAPSKNAVRDKIESMGSSVSDAAYGVGWNGDTTTAPSKNAVYDKIEALGSSSAGVLATVFYNPGVQTVLSTSSGSMADVDSTNLRIASVVAPASGKVMVQLTAFCDTSTGGVYEWRVDDGGSFASTDGYGVTRCPDGTMVTANLFVTGLTPGNTYTNIDWQHCQNSSGTGRIICGGGGFPPAIMVVYAIP